MHTGALVRRTPRRVQAQHTKWSWNVGTQKREVEYSRDRVRREGYRLRKRLSARTATWERTFVVASATLVSSTAAIAVCCLLLLVNSPASEPPTNRSTTSPPSPHVAAADNLPPSMSPSGMGPPLEAPLSLANDTAPCRTWKATPSIFDHTCSLVDISCTRGDGRVASGSPSLLATSGATTTCSLV